MSSTMADMPAAIVSPPARAANILVMEDSQTLRLALCAYLKNSGLNAVEAGSAAEALHRIKNPLVEIDLVFAGIELDGLMLANWLRQNRPGTRVLLAGQGTAEMIKMADTLAADAPFFVRPYDFGAVAKMIRQVLSARVRA